ncbi:serine phosphatase RsbU (regulator of sigma subunit)/anti-sigma regulatory factor (Ser/Thr protein kinase) [Streptomonospora salina]|uniref:Serine phosphatase RsbU (Regulator of sigma subunit)/anti-sigma regulatory factor (Ser/Thr protein kinase) n=5 Tax=Nocardiopsidaceae TaxID=83676 RepID=A0A841EFN2_9ACTN|nr:SpoIIE family protein phosphatase [Streptomonospora salina]MBB5999220.1 serine phosphatase RsbU (regulator of sigma subunit)/anti-sigma regulatory factor (Ser/Thr protein kinase) [Streptomonospora salina]
MPHETMKAARREFSPTPGTAAEARDFVRDTLAEWSADQAADDVVLLVSELVTNAVVHAESNLELVVRRLPSAVEVVVADRVPERAVPQAGPLSVDVSASADPGRSGGLGLALAGAVASSWGVSYSKDDKAVWFRIRDEDGEASKDPDTDGETAGTSLEPPDPVRPARRRPFRPNPWAALDAALSARLPLPELLDRTVEYSRSALGGDAAYIALATTDETEWDLRAATGLTDEPWRPFRSRTEETFPSVTPAAGATINDDLMIARAHRGKLAQAGMRSLVTAPLIVDGRVAGLIGVASRRVRHFGDTAAKRLQDGADRIALPIERARLAEVELARRASLSFLAEASDLLTGTLDEQMTAALACQLVASRLGSWCAVESTSELGTTRLTHAIHRNENYNDVLRTLLTELPPHIQREARPLWSRESLSAAGLVDELLLELAEGPAISVPLVAHGQTLGRLTLGKDADEDFTRDDVDVVDDLARRVSSALENARLYAGQTSMSEALQRSLLPAKEKEPAIPGVDHAVFYRSADERTVVGGDFYDVFATDGRWCFAIGDVCGTGPEAAAVTGLARHTLRALAREGFSPAHIMDRLNKAILDENTSTRFLTMLYGEMTPLGAPGQGMRLRLVSAGHPLPLRLDRKGEVGSVGSSQPLLGAFEDVEFFTETLEIGSGDVLLAVTDGVTERRNGTQMLGDEGLRDIFTNCSGLTAQAVIVRIDRDLEEFAPGGHTDDTAMLVLRFL